MQRLVDNGLAIAKESVKTFTHESLNNVVRVINGVSALVLTVIPGKAGILDGIHGWELRPTYRGPKLPRWMENGASSFNQLIHDLSAEDASSSSNFGSSDEDDGDESEPSSPVSQASRVSRVSTVSKCDRNQVSWITRVFLWIMWPLAFMICFPFRIYRMIVPKRPRHRKVDSLDNNVPLRVHSRKANLTKDHVLDHTTDRRRGVIEDLQLAIEIFIENVFSIFHKVAHFILSPITTLQMLNGWLFFGNRGGVNPSGTSSVSVPTSTLGDADPTPTERPATYRNTLNTDSRTCRDIITELGYPYEAINVVTSDGYILLLERIPRHDSQKVVYLQHGILDSSLGWVSNGVVGSPAFAAYDQGYDVFLGNLRGMVSRGHIDKNIPARKYWNYSINEHGTRDMPAIVDKIHELKTSELKIYLPEQDQEGDDQPYKLCAICHSLGGASMLMYLVTRRLEKIPHHISRLILLSPAGFHDESTVLLTLLSFILCPFAPVLAPLIPGFYIPTWFLRMLFNKLARDFHNYPAVGGLVQTIMSYLVGGDSSNWVGLIGQPHYNMNDMPGVSYFVAVHLSQIKRAKKFNMFDYGSKSKNMKAYGSPKPLDVGSLYGLIDVPVDLVAGCRDKVIPASMVRKHYKLMKDAGVEVSYNEFEYAHVDFVFSNSDDFLAYIMSKLLLVVPPPSRQNDQKHLRIKRLTRRRNNGSKKSMDLTTDSELLEFRATENEIVAES